MRLPCLQHTWPPAPLRVSQGSDHGHLSGPACRKYLEKPAGQQVQVVKKHFTIKLAGQSTLGQRTGGLAASMHEDLRVLLYHGKQHFPPEQTQERWLVKGTTIS